MTVGAEQGRVEGEAQLECRRYVIAVVEPKVLSLSQL